MAEAISNVEMAREALEDPDISSTDEEEEEEGDDAAGENLQRTELATSPSVSSYLPNIPSTGLWKRLYPKLSKRELVATPTTREELYQVVLRDCSSSLFGGGGRVAAARERLALSISNSVKARRPLGQSFIVLFGQSGVGKSSTINHLLNTELAKVSDSSSETRATTEYMTKTYDKMLGVKDITLSIVDTPGTEDTDGIEQAACNLVSVKNFFEAHPSFKFGGIYPNIILIVVPATDHRFMGPRSAFRKMLKAIDWLGLVDQKNPNVVCAITFATFLKSKKALDERKKSVEQIIKNVLRVSGAPVVLIENDTDDLTRKGDMTILPVDGTVQPRNLFQAMVDIAREANDTFSQHALCRFFEVPKKRMSKAGKGISSLANIFEDADQLNPEELKALALLQKVNRLKEIKTQLHIQIEEYIQRNELTEDIKIELIHFQEDMVANKKSVSDIQSSTIGRLCQLCVNPPSPEAQVHIIAIFGIKTSERTAATKIIKSVGSGYNLLTDSFVPSAIFVHDEASITETSFGIHVPKGITIEMKNETKTYMEQFSNTASYVKYRLGQLHVTAAVKPEIFKFDGRAGFNIASGQTQTQVATEQSFLFEQRLFVLSLKDWSEDMTITKTFRRFVKEFLPDTFDEEDVKNRKDFEDFFNKWGHYVTTSAFGGGTVEVKVKLLSSENSVQDLFDARAELDGFFNYMTTGSPYGLGSFSASSERTETRRSLQKSFDMSWHGGDHRLHMNTKAEADRQKWQDWVSSLSELPEVLTTEMCLMPIYEVVQHVDRDKADGCRAAHAYFLEPCEQEPPARTLWGAFRDTLSAPAEFFSRKYVAWKNRPTDKGGFCSVM